MKRVLLILLVLMPFTLILNINTSKANENSLLNNFEGVYHLEYFLQFSPYKKGYSTTKYGLDLEKLNDSGESYLKISLYYEDLQLTIFNDNYSYIISIPSREISETSKKSYNEYLTGTHTELFLNTSEFENPHIIRIDEPLTFSGYFEDYQAPESLRSDITFNYMGIKEYNAKLLYNFTTYHYHVRHVLLSGGDF
ncbi:MAG: hypothetical protein ACFFG0_40020 [Candidatus Thorarchaeota archaeon]